MSCLTDVSASVLQTVHLSLSPAQSEALAELRKHMRTCPIVFLRSDPGMGRTSILRELASETRAAFLSSRELLEELGHHSPLQIEEAFLATAERALSQADLVIWDDVHLITEVAYNWYYARRYLLSLAISALVDRWRRSKKFVFGTCKEKAPWVVRHSSMLVALQDFEADDYRTICGLDLDYGHVFRHAPGLNAYQLRSTRCWLEQVGEATTDSFIEYLDSQDLTSNVDLEEVAPTSWVDLKGIDDLITELEAKVALPFENGPLSAELGLKPKRGVLLAGPPGTGKTTIGRALAHRLKGKFFLVDGTVIAGCNDFYEEVKNIFEAAKRNAPSVIFVDDADVIFEEGNNGFYRYLLTMLDGLATESAKRVCVILTAMEPRCLPAALLRSGRIELWLDTRAPDETAREAILRDKLASLPEPFASLDLSELVQASRGLTGADLKAAAEDGKLLYAHAISIGQGDQDVGSYFLRAIADIRANRVRYRRPARGIASEPVIGFTS